MAIRHFSLAICSCARSAKRRKETEKNGSKNEKSSITKINNFHRKMTFKRTISIPKIGLNSFQSPRPVCTSPPLLLKLFFISKCLNCYLVQQTMFGINTTHKYLQDFWKFLSYHFMFCFAACISYD